MSSPALSLLTISLRTLPDDGALRDRLKALAQERRRFDYHVFT